MRTLPLLGKLDAGPCTDCIAGCCRSFKLIVEGFDAYRIGRDLSLPLRDFVELRWVEAADEEHRIVLDPNDGRFHALMLIRLPDHLPEHPLRCIFLVDLGETARCAVYASRPTMCRAYPSYLADGAVETSGGKYCPPGAWHSENMDLPRLRRHHRFRQRQQSIDARLVDRWNAELRSQRSPDDFFEYLVNAYVALEVRQPEWFAQPSSGELEPIPPDTLKATVEAALASVPL